MIGRIHSIESMGLVDGPGIRTVVFFQGCKLRCAYCHNPDTWLQNGGTEITPDELIKKILRFKPYFQKSGGGVTFSGGEPLLQPDFLIEMLKLCKENGIHTAIDTSGYGIGKYEEVLKYADMVLLDIKHIDNDGYKSLVGMGKDGLDEFLQALRKSEINVWIRHVMVPGVTDSKDAMDKLAAMIGGIKNVTKFEILPYHTLGVSKYEKLNLPYKLKAVSPMSKVTASEYEKHVKNIINIKNFKTAN